MNPPYGRTIEKARKYLGFTYPLTKNDIYAAFFERATDFLDANRGYVGALTSRTYLQLPTFEKLRRKILLERSKPVAVADLGFNVLDDAVVETAAGVYAVPIGTRNCGIVFIDLTQAKAQVLVNYLPVGSRKATRFYAQAAIDARCAFVNCMPEFIGSDKEWSRKFEVAGLPVAGDDIKSQVGATILHRMLVRLCLDRGVIADETYQLNLGGDTDFLNMTVEERLITKRISKTEAVTSLVPYELPTRIGPSDYVAFLNNKKICYLTLKGRKFGDRPITINAKLEVEDSPNSAGVVIDLIRAAKIALDRKISGALLSIAAYAFKHPPAQVPDPQARQWTEDWIAGKRER